MTDITRILELIENGSTDPANELFPAVYDELRNLAEIKISHEHPGQTLSATGLVHEAFLRLKGTPSFESRRHFFGAAAEAMRRIMIDRARARNAKKRGGKAARVDFDINQLAESITDSDRLESLNHAITRFEELEPEKAELVKLRYFTGLTIREAADILGVSTATADRHWAYARAWLQNELKPDP